MFDQQGNFLRKYRRYGKNSSDLAVGINGEVYVVDYGLEVFDAKGSLIGKWAGEEFQYLSSSAYAYENGMLYISDQNNRVNVFRVSFLQGSTLNVVVSPLTGGVVTSSPSGINCGNGNNDCSETADSGTTITLTATPDSGYRFTGWGGACSGTGTCSVTVDSALKDVTANFSLNDPPVEIEAEAVLSVSIPASVEESATGMNIAIFEVVLTSGVTAAEDIEVLWSVDCATDVNGFASSADFVGGCPSGTVTIGSGETSASFSFMTLDDEIREGTERFTVSIAAMTLGSFDVVFDDGADEFVSELNLLDDETVRFAVNFEGRAGPSSVLDGEFVDLSLLSVEEGEFVEFRLRLDEPVSETEAVVLPWEISFDTASSDDFASGQAFAGTVEIPPNSLTSEPLNVGTVACGCE